MSRIGKRPSNAWESCGILGPSSAPIAPYSPATTLAPSASQPSDRKADASEACRPAESGAIVERPATLQAVKVPVKPETKEKPIAINTPVMGVAVTL
jgi:hypothetical protein